MCESASGTNLLENKIEKLNLKDTEKCETCERQGLMLKDTRTIIDMDMLSELDDMLYEKLGVTKSIIKEHRDDIIPFLKMSESNSRIADTINIDHAEQVHIGHVINVTEQIILNADTNELEYIDQPVKDFKDWFPIIDRMHWLAQPSVSEISHQQNPAQYVIICHTATQEAFTQAENILMLRLTQTFHIESQGWADIAYNFAIGSDGNAYEGRGWLAEGSHTLSYNAHSIGIAFIGCFLSNLPPPTSLKKCKDLIAHGVQIGAISPNYELIAHCQCRPFLSPGDCLFKEIQTWERFSPNITNKTPCIIQELENK